MDLLLQELDLIYDRLLSYKQWKILYSSSASDNAKLFRSIELTNCLDRLEQIVVELKKLEGVVDA